MAGQFDPYHEWLGIPPHEQPPNYYRLLGIQPREGSWQVISNAAQRQVTFLGAHTTGPQGIHAQRLLAEIVAAQACLLDPAAKAAYDATLATSGKRRGLRGLLGIRPAAAEVAAGHPAQQDDFPRWLYAAIGVGVVTVLALLIVAILALRRVSRDAADRTVAEASSIIDEDVREESLEREPEASAVMPSATAPEALLDGAAAVPTAEPPTAFPADAAILAAPPRPAPLARPQIATERVPVPPVERLAQARQQVTAAHAEPLRAAITPEARRRLVETLAQQAGQAPDAAQRYAMFDRARTLAMEAGDLRLALSVIGELERHFEIDPRPLTIEIVKKLAQSVTSPEEQRLVAQTAMTCAQTSGDAGDKELAESLYVLALGAVRQLHDAALEGTIQRRLAALTPAPVAPVRPPAPADLANAVTSQEVAQAYQVLLRNPKDANAHLTFGRFLCFVQGDWRSGLPHLVMSSDAKLAKLARDELLLPRTAKNVSELADAWYDWGQKADGSSRRAAWSRARAHYQAYLTASPRLLATRRERIDQRMAEMNQTLADRALNQAWLAAPPGLVRSFEGHEDTVTALAVSADGAVLASAAEDRTVRLWDLGNGREVWKQQTKTSHLNGVVITPFLPDGRFVISNYDDQQFAVLHAADGRLARNVGQSPMSPTALRLSPDGLSLVWAARSRPPNLFVWSLAKDQPLGAYGEGDCPNVLALSPDGQRIATGDSRGVVRVWETDSGKMLHQIRAHQDAVTDLDFSPGGQHVATAALNEICVFDLATYEPLRTLRVESVRTAAFSPDGRRLASGGFREEVFVWDVQTGRRYDTLKAEAAFSERHITRLAFLPDPRGLITGATGGKIRLWRLPD